MLNPLDKPLSSPGFRPDRDYAFTEITTLYVPLSININDVETPEGAGLLQSIQSCVSQPGSRTAWWGRSIEFPEIMTLAIDWEDTDKCIRFRQSKHAVKLHQRLMSVYGISELHSSFYALESRKLAQENAFSNLHDCLSVMFVFKFNRSRDLTDPDPEDDQVPKRTKLDVFECAWSKFRDAALQSKGAVTSNAGLGGWSVANGDSDISLSFCGVIGFMDYSAAKRHLVDIESRAWMAGGMQKLRALATGGHEASFLNMTGLGI